MAFSGIALLVGHDSRAFGDHWVSSSLKGAMRAPLHVLVVLLCSVYRVFSCSLLFLGSPPLSSPVYYIFYIVLFIIYPVGSPLFFQFSVMGGLLGVLAAWVRGQQFQPPMFLGTQPPYAMKV